MSSSHGFITWLHHSHVAIFILSFEPEGPGFKLTSPASRSNLKNGREGGSGSNFRLKHTFKRGNFALNKLGDAC